MSEITREQIEAAMLAEVEAVLETGPLSPRMLVEACTTAINRLYRTRLADAVIVERNIADPNRLDVYFPAEVAHLIGLDKLAQNPRTDIAQQGKD